MIDELVIPPKATAGDRIAVLSPSFAAPEQFPAVHEQAMSRLAEITGLVPIEYPSTRTRSSPSERGRDLNSAFADPTVRAIIAVIGGDDQITVIPHLDIDLARADPKPFLGYSDNTNLLNWLWCNGIAGYYGGSTQVHLGPGPGVDPCHAASLRAALLTGGQLRITEPGESEDFGQAWTSPSALTDYGAREPTEPWTWAGPARSVTGRTWGGCLEVIQWILTAGRFPTDATILDGAVLLVETSEELISAREFRWILRSLGERGLLSSVDAVLVARAPASDLQRRGTRQRRADHRRAQRDASIEIIERYNPDAVVCVGIPFGHTRPQWILPYGGTITVDGTTNTIHANYS